MNPASYQAILDDLIRDEGTGPERNGRLFAYDDSTGKEPILAVIKNGRLVRSKGNLTIGHGRNLTAKGISTRESADLLEADVAEAVGALGEKLPWWLGLPSPQKRALVNLCFNLGIDGLLGFPRFLADMQAGRYLAARHELETAAWHRQVKARAVRVEALIA